MSVSAIADSDGKCGRLGPSTSRGADDTLASFSNYGSLVDLADSRCQHNIQHIKMVHMLFEWY